MSDLSARAAEYYYNWGFKPTASTGIHGGLTLGYGKLDHNGYWQYELPYNHIAYGDEYVAYARELKDEAENQLLEKLEAQWDSLQRNDMYENDTAYEMLCAYKTFKYRVRKIEEHYGQK